MKDYFKTSLVLAIICAVAALMLSSLNSVTAPIIKAYNIQQTINALESVNPGYNLGKNFAIDSEVSPYYIPLTENGNIKGYILELSTNGYGGLITIVASYDLTGKVMKAKVVRSSETPGLGKKSDNSWYMTKYIDKDPIPTTKTQLSSKDSAAISGASITFAAIGQALFNGSEYIKTLEAK
ncbi:MAG: FMN-binding protein [Spirochaetaceae bacterium]|nr:FMN-binding protein [Spirochaetaceae bacterium]